MIGNLADARNLASKVTWRRMKNAGEILSSYHLSRWRKRASIAGLPISISIEPTTSCNLRCPECPSGLRSFTRPTGMLDTAMFKNIIDQIASSLTYLTFYFQGEPYLHTNFTKMVSYASRKGIYTSTSTNGHYLTEENARQTIEAGLDRLIISIDGTTQETYESYRVGGSLEKVIEGAKNIIRLKRELKSRTPYVVFQFLVVKPNEHQIEDVAALGKQLGVDQVVFKTAQIYDFENGSPLIPEQQEYSRYRKNSDGIYELKNGLYNECWRMWHSCVITWDGKVVPCCFDKDATHVLGDLKRHTFQEIWQGERYQSFRNTLLRSRADIEICKNCTEGTKVWA